MKKVDYFFNETDTKNFKDYFNKIKSNISMYYGDFEIDNRYSFFFTVESINDDNYGTLSLEITLNIKDNKENKRMKKNFYYRSVADFQAVLVVHTTEFKDVIEILFRLNLSYESYIDRAENLDRYTYNITAPTLFYGLLHYNNLKNEYELMELLCLYSFLSDKNRKDSKLTENFKSKLNYYGLCEDDIKDEEVLNSLEITNNKEYLLYSTLNPILRFLFKNESCEGEFKGFPLNILKKYAEILDKGI